MPTFDSDHIINYRSFLFILFYIFSVNLYNALLFLNVLKNVFKKHH